MATKLSLVAAVKEFNSYFLDLSKTLEEEGEGASVDRAAEWGLFIDRWLEDGEIDAETAETWRSI